MCLTNILLDAINESNGYVMKLGENNNALLVPGSEYQYYMPSLVVSDLDELEDALQQYISIIKKGSLKFYKIDDNHKIKNYLFYLIKSLSNTDCQDFVSYVRRFTSYLVDECFDNLYYKQDIGTINGYNIIARKCEEYYGSETPYTMRYYVEVPGFRFEMPLIRYGITDNDEVYIYSVQRKRLYNNYNSRIKSINSVFSKVNSGVKHNRDITPSMLCSLAIFMGMLKSHKINHVRVDGFLTRRYGYFDGITDDSERDKILHHSVDKFNKLFLRLAMQFDGIDIKAYPLDIDSYFHIALGDNISSKNSLLNDLYNIGFDYQKNIEKKLIRKQ